MPVCPTDMNLVATFGEAWKSVHDFSLIGTNVWELRAKKLFRAPDERVATVSDLRRTFQTEHFARSDAAR